MVNGKLSDVNHLTNRLINSAVYFLYMPLHNYMYSHSISCFVNTTPQLSVYLDYCIEIVLNETEWLCVSVLPDFFQSRLTDVIKASWIMFPKYRSSDSVLCSNGISVCIDMKCCSCYIMKNFLLLLSILKNVCVQN